MELGFIPMSPPMSEDAKELGWLTIISSSRPKSFVLSALRRVKRLIREIIGSLFNLKNTESLYIGGVFCVQEKFRHSDVGRKLLNACDEHSGGKNIGVNTDIHKVGPYMRRGVKIIETDWKSIEYETYTPVNPAVLSDELPSGVEIVAFQNSHLPAIHEYDYSLAGYERKSLIETSCKEENSITLVAMKDGKCVGFGSIKLNIMELGRVGPLYADDPSVAEAMVKRLITAMPEAKGFATVTISTNLSQTWYLRS
ncbi:n-acetyltransferase domain-containing protein [Trichonephila inaurata madagascariensis]|uniref:N-acetyltransferase domain-containing protein n=1 Tax=Trichonephila inaurata madagascariensis TaxID=2747483 RepID=A0A8X6MIF1_9ARAC|nr:n-acetyltransferase domain-containing protein [Trichonephila inaurata madagascariensis]